MGRERKLEVLTRYLLKTIILSQNTAFRCTPALIGRGFCYSRNVPEFSGNFLKSDILSGADILIKRKRDVLKGKKFLFL